MQVTDATFQRDVLDAPQAVLVDFWASWCPPCKMMEPLVERLREEYSGRAQVVGLNIDRNPQTAAKYGIGSVPTFAVFVDGQLHSQRTGASTESQLRCLIETAIELANATDTTATNSITIVSGLPRSGTSMMMRMLEAGGLEALTDGVRSADEDNPHGYYEFEAVKTTRDNPSWLKQARSKVVKMVYSLLRDLPADYEYRVLFMRRHMVEILASQRRMLERNGKPLDCPDEQMTRMFEHDLQTFEKWIATQPNFSVLDVSLNELLANPSEQIVRINTFLDNKLDTTAMDSVIDTSLYRQRVA